MHIMLVNDDGIAAPGLLALKDEALRRGHRVTAFAPESERSAYGHAITISDPLRVTPYVMDGARAYAIGGTPADCARLGLYVLRQRGDQADYTISGINRGHNMGGACVYSGTINAALEAAMSGCQSMAVSRVSTSDDDYTDAAKLALDVLEWTRKRALPRGVIYNLNIPYLPYADIRGIKPAELSRIFISNPSYELERREDGCELYRLTNEAPLEYAEPNCDEYLTRHGFATITPISWNMAVPGFETNIDIPIL